MTIYKVPVEHINGMFSRIIPFIEEPLKQQQTHRSDDVLGDLLSSAAHLWINLDDEGTLLGVQVTKVNVYPRMRRMCIWLCGGEFPWEELEMITKHWAQIMGCKELEIWGRSGWNRRFKSRRDFVVLRQEIE